jgi:hypothetical protein
MDFLLENWHLVGFGLVVLVVLVWDIFLKRAMTLEHEVHVLIILFKGYEVAWVTQELRGYIERHADVAYFLTQLSNRANNEHARSILGDLNDKLHKLKDMLTEALSESEVKVQLSRTLRKTTGRVFLFDHYILLSSLENWIRT